MKHKHVTTCEHEIKVCDCCDTAYCTKCDKEWASEKVCTLPHYPTYIPYYPQPVIAPSWRPYWNVFPYGSSVSVGGGFTLTGNTMRQLDSTGANIQ